MDPYKQEIVNDIESTLNDVDRRLQGKSKEEQQRILHDERDILISIVCAIASGIVFFAPVPVQFLVLCGYKLLKVLGFDPFQWLTFVDENGNARMADEAYSDPELYNALIKGGKIFEEKNNPYLNRKSKHVREKITSTSNVNELADSIITFCKVVPMFNGQPMLVDSNDLKILIGSTLETILKSTTVNQKVQETCQTPIYKPGAYGWVKYKFSSSSDIQSSCCSETKFVELDLEVLSYCFPSEIAFRRALRETE